MSTGAEPASLASSALEASGATGAGVSVEGTEEGEEEEEEEESSEEEEEADEGEEIETGVEAISTGAGAATREMSAEGRGEGMERMGRSWRSTELAE